MTAGALGIGNAFELQRESIDLEKRSLGGRHASIRVSARGDARRPSKYGAGGGLASL